MLHIDPSHGLTSPARYACIDCGTNSIKLVVADLGMEYPLPVFEASLTTRVGEGMQANNMRLREAPMQRTLDAMAEFTAAAKAHDAQEIVLVGTAALRDAQNSADFAHRARERCGLNLEIIPGDEEARLSYVAVRRDPHWRKHDRLLVIDIGGGSTEIIQGEAGTDRVKSRLSVNLGAVKLTEACLRSDPPTVAQLAAANQAALAAFDVVPVPDELTLIPHVVGVGGTLTNLSAMQIGASVEPERLHGSCIRVSDLEDRCAKLAVQSIAERRSLPGLNPDRADIILAGAILLVHALSHVKSDRVDVSTRGLRWGLLYDRFLPYRALDKGS